MRKSFIISIYLFATATAVSAQDFRLADSLLQTGDYALAAVEYERCHYCAGSRDVSLAALRQKAQCYKHLQRYDLAASTFERCAATYADHIQIALCHYLSGHYSRVVETAQSAGLVFDTASIDMLLLHTLALNEMQCYDSASAVAFRLAGLCDSAAASRIRAVVSALYSRTPRLKSEATARWLSFFPGLGHLYAGYPLEAVTALLLNAAALGFGVWQVLDRCYITAYIGGAGTLSATYPGVMKSASLHVRKTNLRRASSFNSCFRRQLIDNLQPALNRQEP